MNELRRILTDKKRLAALIAIPIVCFGLFLLDLMSGDLRLGWKWMMNYANEYRANYAQTESMTLDEIAEFPYEYYGVRDGSTMKSVAVHVMEYDTYLDVVKAQAEKMSNSSVFSKNKNSFTYRNIQKTARDFEALRGIKAEFGANKAVETWLGFKTADALYVLVIVLVVLSFFEDRKNGLAPLVRAAPRGRTHLAVSRAGILFLTCAVYAVLMYLAALMFSFRLYGGLDGLDRAVQSIEGFKKCTMHLSIRQWIFMWFGVRALTGFFIGLIFWAVLSFLSHMQLAWLAVLGIFGAEYAAYTLIKPQMALSVFRFVNLFSYVHPTELLSRYENMNFFGLPVGALSLLAWIMALAGAALLFAAILIQVKRRPFGNRSILGGVINAWNRFSDFFRRRFPIPAMEAYKLVVLGGTAIFLVAAAYFGPKLGYRGYEYWEEDYVYTQYLEEMDGPIGRETYDYLEKAERQLEQNPYADASFFSAIERLKAETASAVQRAEAGGYQAWMIDQADMNNCFGEKVWPVHRWSAIAAMAFLILCIAPVFAYERQSGTDRILRAAPRGRRAVFFSKYLVIFAETLFLWCVIYLPQLLKLIKFIGRDTLAAPIQNINALSGFGVGMSLGVFIALLFALRFVGMLITAHVAAYLSSLVNSWEKAAVIGAVLLITPALLFYFGQEWAGFISVTSPISAIDVLARKKAAAWIALCAAWLAAAVTLTALVYKKRTGAAGDQR